GQYMVRPQSGVASVNAIGVNYSDTWGKRDQVTFQGSYFFNNTDTENRSTTEKWYETPYADTLSTVGYSDTKSYNHRFNGRLEWKISQNQNLMIRPSFSYQSNDPLSWTQGWQWGEYDNSGNSGYSRIDNGSNSSRSGYRVGTNAVYRAKLGKDGRTITVNGSFSYSDNKNTATSTSNLLGYQPVIPSEGGYGAWTSATYVDPETGETKPYVDPRYLYDTAPSSSYNLRGEFTYTEPVAKHAQVSLQYRAQYEHQERDKKSYETGEDYSIVGLLPSSSLSNSYESNYLTQRVGPGFRYSKDRNTFVANVFYQRSSLDGQVMQSDNTKIRRNYNDVTYFMMGQLNINRENSLRLFVSSYTNNPSVSQLQGIFDLSNAQNISSGNPELNPSYNHSVNFHYVNSNVEKGRTFMWMFSMNAATDYITSNVQYNGTEHIDDVDYSYLQYTRPINMDGYWGLRTHLSYGLPIGFLKCNFNVMAGINYTKTPSRIDGQRNDAENMGYDFRAVLGSNISENVDFTL
ncbi:MAG: outer membrane beta-barrel family protein, partial [Alistipes sp.]|nr:outer membrane beta-barrel family protein [Alistipes sp.]